MNVDTAASKSPFSFSLISGFRRLLMQSQGEIHYIGAVSYTHLDVYKRQLHTWVFNGRRKQR